MTLPELLSLVQALRQHGLRVSGPQVISAWKLVMMLRVLAKTKLGPEAAPDEKFWVEYLAPVFCTSINEQGEFKSIYLTWHLGRYPSEESASEQIERKANAAPKNFIRIGWSALAIGVTLWLAIALASLLTPENAPTEIQPKNITTAPPDVSVGTTLANEAIWLNAVLVAMPMLVCAIWLFARQRGKASLRRVSRTTPQSLHKIYLPGGLPSLLPNLPLRRIAQALRRRHAIDSQALLIEPTISATLRAGGAFTPVCGASAEPTYISLVDRASASDHLALLVDELLRELRRSEVDIAPFELDSSSGRVRPCILEESLLRTTRVNSGAAVASHRATSWNSLNIHTHSEHQRVLIFSDGEGFFDPYSGLAQPWLAEIAESRMVLMFTPVPSGRWSERERAIKGLGIGLFELSSAGLSMLMTTFEGTPVAARHVDGQSVQRSHEGQSVRWLQREVPPASVRQKLLADVRSDIGATGMIWLAACAAYPEVAWGITLRSGKVLVPNVEQFAELLYSMSRLVWLRKSYMPDWLRCELLAQLTPPQAAQVRRLLHDMLDRVSTRGQLLPLTIGTEDTTQQSEGSHAHKFLKLVGEAFQMLRLSDSLRHQSLRASADDPIQDHVLMRFRQGLPFNKHDVPAPVGLLRAMRAAPRVLGASGLLAMGSALGVSLWLYSSLPMSRPVPSTVATPPVAPSLPSASTSATASEPPPSTPRVGTLALAPSSVASAPGSASSVSSNAAIARPARAEKRPPAQPTIRAEPVASQTRGDTQRSAPEAANTASAAPSTASITTAPESTRTEPPEKVSAAADCYFDSDSDNPKCATKVASFAKFILSIEIEVVIAVGHTDSVEARNTQARQQLSERRARSVKALMVMMGVEEARIYTEGKGESQPVADNNTASGRSKNRRVELEAVGTRPKK